MLKLKNTNIKKDFNHMIHRDTLEWCKKYQRNNKDLRTFTRCKK